MMNFKLDGGLYLGIILVLAVVAIIAIVLLLYAKEDQDIIKMIIYGVICCITFTLIFFSYKNLKKDLRREEKTESIISINYYDDDKSIIETEKQKYTISNNLIRKAHISDKNLIEFSISDLGIVRFQKLYITPELYKSLGY